MFKGNWICTRNGVLVGIYRGMCTRIGDLLCMRAKDQKCGAKRPFFVPIFVPFGWVFVGTFCVKNGIGVTNGVTNGVTKLGNKMRGFAPIIQKKLPS